MNSPDKHVERPGRRPGWWWTLLGALLMVTAAPLPVWAAQGPPPPSEEADDAGTDGAGMDEAGTNGVGLDEDAGDASEPADDTEETADAAAEPVDDPEPAEDASENAAEPADEAEEEADDETEPPYEAEEEADGEAEPPDDAEEEADDEAEPPDEAEEEADDETEPPDEAEEASNDQAEPPDNIEEAQDDPKTRNSRTAAADDKKAEGTNQVPPNRPSDRDQSKVRRPPRTAKERMEEIRRLREKERREGKSRPPTRSRTPPKPPSPHPTARAQEGEKKGDDPARRRPFEKDRFKPGYVEGAEPELPDLDLPAEERTYVFSIDGDYADLINAFSRMSGLGVIGDAPTGPITLKSAEKMDFKSALNRVRLLLFKHPDNYWLVRNGNLLEIIRVNEIKRVLPLEDIYRNVEAFEAADRDENDLVMLLYSPQEGSVDDLTEIRDFLPDYVLMASMGDPSKNAMTIFALVKDIRKFLDLVELFREPGKDPRIIKTIPVEYIAPSTAVDLLGQLMDLSGRAGPATSSRTSSRKSPSTAVRGVPRGISIVPDDAQQVLIVRALQSEIDEIERILPFIDVAPDTGFKPVVIPLKHVSAEGIMSGLSSLLTSASAPPAPSRSSSKSKTSRRPSRASTPSAVSNEDVTVVPEPRTNKLIVVGSKEGIDRVRQIVALLDVEARTRPTTVEIKHGDPVTVADQVRQMVQGIRDLEGSRPTSFSVTPNETTNSVILIGRQADVDLAVELIGKWDVEGSEPTMHKYRLRYAKPSDVANMLSRLGSGKPPPTRRPPSKKASSKSPPRRTAASVGQFIGDDVNGLIYVVCTDDDWEQKYLPLIEELDSDAGDAQLATHTIGLTHAEPQEAIDTLSAILAGRGEVPQMVAQDDGILVIGANEAQIEQLEGLVLQIDTESEDVEQRMFELQYAEPAQIREAILTMLSPQPARQVRRTSSKGGKKPPRAPPSAPGDQIRIMEVNGSLLVAAPAEKMEEIADLIARLDVDTAAKTEIRVYPFPPGVDVQDVADGLTRLVGDGRASPGRRSRKGGKAAPSAADGGAITVIPQPSSHRILVSAPTEEFPRIEETIQALASESQIVESVYEFIELEGGNANVIVPMVESILQPKINELISLGEIPAPQAPGSKGKGPARQPSVLTIQADPRNDRIVISAPQVIVAEAKALIDALDRPEDDTERVIRTVILEKTEPQEMTATINAMLTGQKRSPTRRPTKPGVKGKPLTIQPGGESILDVRVTPAPGGQAIVLMGPALDVEEVEGWIRGLDEKATGTGKIIKVYDLQDADAEQVADTLMAVVDTGGAVKPGKRKGADEAPELDWDLNITRTGKDLYISSDYFSGTMLVAATPAKMREVDDIITTLFVGDEEAGIGPLVAPEQPVPYMTYPLRTVEAFDAVYTLENILAALWVPPDDKPMVDYIPFTNILVIKGKPDRFKEVEDLIVKYVDTGTGKPPTGRTIIPITGTGMTAEDAAKLLTAELAGLGFEVEVDQLYPEQPTGTLEQEHPCVLPPGVFDAVNAAVLSATGQVGQDDQEPDADAVLRDFAKALQEEEPAEDTAGADSADAEGTYEQPKPVAKLRIRFDDKKGVLVVEGPHTAIDGAEDLIEKIKEDVKELTLPPDIRIYRLKHIDPNKAAEILDTMFNARQLRAQQQQMARMQQQMQRQQQRRQQQQRGQQGKEGQQGPQGRQAAQQPQMPQMPQMAVTVYPNSRNRTIIIRAATEAFPAIIDLLATLDKQPTTPLDYKIFTLTNLVAEEVEAQIKAMLKIDGRSAPRRAAQRRPGERRGVQPVEQDMIQMELPGGESWTASAAEITITSNAATNTLFVMAPKEAMELVERFINDMEALEKPEFVTKTYDLKHADATDVADHLDKLFKAARGGRKRGKATGEQEGFDPTGMNAPTFLADARTNSVIVRALEIDLPKIEPLIERLDVPYEETAVQLYKVVNGNAEAMAKTLQQIYGDKGGGRKKEAGGAKEVKIVGDAESNTIFVTAAPKLQAEIGQRIADMEERLASSIEPRTIKIHLGTPSEIAKKIDEALGGGGRGKRASRIRIVGDDAGKQLVVSAPEELMSQIESLAAKLDVPPTEVDVKIYPLEHARATEILQGLNQMVRQAMSQIRGTGAAVDMFSATADERSNSLVVMGGPVTFMLVEKVLKDVDIPPRDPTQVVTAIYQLVNANAAEVARNINNVYGKRREKGVDPPKAEANPSGNSVIVRGTKAQVEEIYEQVIKPLEESMVVTTTELKDERIPLQYAKADEVAQTLTQRFNDKFRAIRQAGLKNIKPSELTVSITAEVNSNSLMVTASEANLAFIKEMLPEIDNEEVGPRTATTTAIYPLTYADPNAVAGVVNNAFRKPGRVAERDRVQAVVEFATLSVVVIASAENQKEIAALIEELDKDTGTATQVRKVYKLQEARASDVARIIDQTLRGSRRPTRKGQLPVSVVANDALNSLVISGTQKEYQDILPLIEELDQKPTEITGLEPRVYVLKYADPGSTISTIQSAFPRLGGQRAEDTVRAAYAWGTASLVVSANAENHEKVAKLLEEIDVESTEDRTVHLVALEYANADDLANKLGQLFGRTTRQQRDQQPISFTSEPGSNRLMVFANEQEMEQIRPLIDSLDVKPEFEKNRLFKSFKLTYAECWEVKGLIDESFRVRTRNPNPRDVVTTMAAWASNSIVVTASPEKMEQVGKLIEEVDKQDLGQREVHVVTVKHIDAEGISQTLNEIFVRGAQGRRGQQTISISNPRGSDTLLVKANETEFAEILQVIEQLDSTEADIGGQIKVVPLKHTDATETMEILQEYLRKPGGGRGRGGELAGDVRISVATATNSLVISGDSEEIEHLTAIIAELDQKSAGQREVHVVTIRHADPAAVNESLNEIFVRGAQGRRGQQTISISNPRGSDTLLVKANETEFAEILPVIEQLDSTEAEIGGQIKVVPLKHTDATETLEILQEYLRKPGGRGGRGGGGELAGDVRISAATATNSLVISGDSEEIEHLTAIIAEVDQESIGQREVHVVTIKHADPAAVNESLNEIFVRGGRGQRGQETISVSNPRGSDTLLVKANETEFAEIQQVIEQLDSTEAEIGGQVKVIPLKYTDATETLEILQEYLRKPGGGRGRGGGGELAGDVRISAATATNSLVISGDSEEIEHLTAVIAQIDVEIEDAINAPKIIKLQYAQASEIEPALTDLFAEQRGAPRRGGGGAATMTPIIVADDGSNSLIVRASAVDYKQIEGLVARLDTEENTLGNDIKIIPLDMAMNAAELADNLDRLYSEVETTRSGGRRGGSQAPRVAIVADSRTNALILMGPRSKFAEIETLARTLEEQGPRGGRVSSVIRLNQRDPEEIRRVLEDMIEEKRSGSTRRGGRRRR